CYRNSTLTPADNLKPARSIGSKFSKSRPRFALAHRYRPSTARNQIRESLTSTPPKAWALGVHPCDVNASEKIGCGGGANASTKSREWVNWYQTAPPPAPT